jgi:hypothetical protein
MFDGIPTRMHTLYALPMLLREIQEPSEMPEGFGDSVGRGIFKHALHGYFLNTCEAYNLTSTCT